MFFSKEGISCKMTKTLPSVLTLAVPNFRRYLSSAMFFFLCCLFLNKLSIGKKFICNVERLIFKQRRS